MLRSAFAVQVDFPLARIGVNAGGLLIGSVETTSQAVAQVIQFFIDQPELLARAKAASAKEDTAEIDGMVWEALRFVPISPYMFRQLSENYTIAKGTDRETDIPKGTNVLTLTQSAMFDTYAYDHPEEFDADRNWYHNFNYGFASHDWLGKYVGMAMIPEMVRQVMLRDDLTASSAINYKKGPFPEVYELSWK
jgi:cytochrome P450